MKTFKNGDIVYFTRDHIMHEAKFIKYINEKLAYVQWLNTNSNPEGESIELIENLYDNQLDCVTAEAERFDNEVDRIFNEIYDIRTLVNVALRYIPPEESEVKIALSKAVEKLTQNHA